ncbi:hypothetical protein AB0F10_44975, partial [Actinoplanes sp. NPDC026623]
MSSPQPSRLAYDLPVPIRTPLAVGPAPGADYSGQQPADQPLDDGIRWLADFEEACLAGMAARVDLSGHPEAFKYGIDRLLVYGVRDDPDPRAAAGVLADLFEAHHHTDGLGYVAPGTPTNQTPDAALVPGRRSPERIAALRVTDRDSVPEPWDSNAILLADALGAGLSSTDPRPGPALPIGRPGAPNALARADGARTVDEAEMRAMNRLLWPATWGGFLWQQMNPVFGDEDIEAARRHFEAYVRANGPLPTLRIGDQPYGILPITPLELWQPVDSAGVDPPGIGPAVVDFIVRLRRDVWTPAIPGLPRISTGGPAPQETALRIFGMAPTAQQVYGRSVLGMEYFAFLWRFSDLNLDERWRAQLRDAADALKARLGRPDWQPRVGEAVFAGNSFPIDAPVIGPDPGQYLTAVADATPAGLRTLAAPGPVARTPLLFRLARQAMLTAYAIAAEQVLNRQAAPPPAGEHLDPELIGVVPGRADVTLWQRLARPVTTLTGATAVLGDYLAAPDARDPAMTMPAAVRAALRRLTSVDPARLDRLVRETLPLSSHRLDAWITSLATRRLRSLRGAGGTAGSGAHLGGYGWVENLSRRPAPAEVQPRPAGEEQHQVYRQDGNAGFVHAPSLAQATTAAVLRAGHQAHATAAGGPLAVDLPSRRVRIAAWLLDGVRQGQSLGALLGYRFERDLQEHPVGTLAAWIDDFRALAPVRGIRVSAGEPPRESLDATSVVDGLALQRLWRTGRLDLSAIGLGAGHAAERDAALDVLRKLDDAVDALGDALLAESVHHAVQGQPLRAGATVDATAGGEAPPPELDSVRTPRTGTTVTHRLILALGDPPAGGWPVDQTRARRLAEPRVDAWLGRLLPAPDTIRCRVRVDLADEGFRYLLTDLAGLRLSPLDYVLMPENGAGDPGDLERHLATALAARPDVGTRATLSFDYTRDPRWTPDVITVPEFLEAVRAARALLSGARALEPGDLIAPGAPVPPAVPDPDLAGRAAAATAAVAAAADARAEPG